MASAHYVLLTGGPFNAPRLWPAPVSDERVKVSDGAGYDHFISTKEFAEHGGEFVRVYVWCYRTLVAE